MATTTIDTQQTQALQQGQGSSGNTANLGIHVGVINQGDAAAVAGDTTAAAHVGSTTFTASLSASASPSPAASASTSLSTSLHSSPSASAAPGVVVQATNSASAVSGSATTIGVVANTNVSGDQAVVVHIPSNTSNQVVRIELDASVSNTGSGASHSGDVNATGLQGSNVVGVGAAPPAATGGIANTVAIPGPGAAPAAAGTPHVDVRDANYAIADSGDALAIGVKSTTIIAGRQKILVIIDDNSSGNRIVITFHVDVSNTGQAQALSGNAAATGQQGDFAAAIGAGDGSSGAHVAFVNGASSASGNARAVGVDATTLVDVTQDVQMQVGRGSSNNQLDVNFDAYISNVGRASARTGTAAATGAHGDADVTLAGGATMSKVVSSITLATQADGRSGDVNATGLTSDTALAQDQNVRLSLSPGSHLPLMVTDGNRVINFGLARAESGAVTVVAQMAPPPPVVPTPDEPQPSISPQPAASVTGSPSRGGSNGSDGVMRQITTAIAPPPPISNVLSAGAPASPAATGGDGQSAGAPMSQPAGPSAQSQPRSSGAEATLPGEAGDSPTQAGISDPVSAHASDVQMVRVSLAARTQTGSAGAPKSSSAPAAPTGSSPWDDLWVLAVLPAAIAATRARRS